MTKKQIKNNVTYNILTCRFAVIKAARKTNGFKCLRLNCWNITQVKNAKCQTVLVGG